MNARILLIDDDPSMQASLSSSLRKEAYHVLQATSVQEGKALFEKHGPDLVLMDIHLPDGSGRDLFEIVHAQNDEIPILMLTAYPDMKGAISLMKKGAFDYLVKPFDLQELKIQIKKALELKRLRTEVLQLKHEGKDKEQTELVGDSPDTQDLRKLIKKIGASDSTVFITGRSGTGKEVVARAIHAASSRSQEILMVVNCAAIPENLLEMELFGHEKGAFTGAEVARKGLFELAHQGTLFLDEIGEMPLSLQPKILRALETLSIKQIGGAREIQIDVRVIAATNRNFEQMIADNHFREDLYYRLNVVPIALSPLKARQEDIAPLANFFLQNLAAQSGVKAHGFTMEALNALMRWPWPGNVRELKNMIERIVILHREFDTIPLIDLKQLPLDFHQSEPSPSVSVFPALLPQNNLPPVQTLEEAEKQHILFVFEHCEKNISQTSQMLGITRNTLKRKLRKYGHLEES